MKLDAFDLKILTVLQRDGRITKARLAEEVGLSPSPCWARLNRLEEAGLVLGYTADLDVRRIAPVTTGYVEVTLRNHGLEDYDRFESYIRAMPQVLECCMVSGGVDYIVKIAAHDIQDCTEMMEDWLRAEVGVLRYVTYFVMKTVKRHAGFPLDYLAHKADTVLWSSRRKRALIPPATEVERVLGTNSLRGSSRAAKLDL